MNNEQVSKLIEQVIYLFSLASRRQDVERFSDTLSIITAHWRPDEQMADSDQQRLKDLESEVKRYLVTQDPLRSFTLESLEKRLSQKPARISNPTISEFGTILTLSLGVGLIAFAASFAGGVQARAMMCVALFFLTLDIGIVWLYISALKNFRSDFRRVYVYIAAAAIVLGLGFSHYLITNLLQWEQYAIFQYGGMTWLIAIPFILMLVGLRQYALLLQIKTRFTSFALVGAIVLAVALISFIVPHKTVSHLAYFHFWAMGACMITTFALLGSVLANKIRQAVTPAFARSMNWIYFYTLAVGLGSSMAGGALFWFGELYGSRLAAVIAGCGILPQLVLLYAAYSFKKETSK